MSEIIDDVDIMIEKLIYIALQYPGEEIVKGIVSKFDNNGASLNRWTWVIQLTNLILLLYVLEKKLGNENELADLHRVIKNELMESIEGVSVSAGDLVVEEEELRYLASKDVQPETATDTCKLASLMLGYRAPHLFHALDETVRNHALDSLPSDYGMMTYLVHECIKQVSGISPVEGDQTPLIAALEVLFEDFYKHIDGQIQEYFSLSS